MAFDGIDGVILATPRRMTVRYLCGIFALPDGCTTEQAETLFNVIRERLTGTYACFPYWKELGTYLVWLSDGQLFDRMHGRVAQFTDKTGLHMNVMLGTVLVDRQKLVSSAASTWGLFYSGAHFGSISATVNDWCRKRRSEQGALPDRRGGMVSAGG